MAVANGKYWFVTRDGAAKSEPLHSIDACNEWIHKHTPFSVLHAEQHEGYRVEERDTVTFNDHVCVREPESGGRGRIWRCLSCHGRDGWFATSCGLWTGMNNRFNATEVAHTNLSEEDKQRMFRQMYGKERDQG